MPRRKPGPNYGKPATTKAQAIDLDDLPELVAAYLLAVKQYEEAQAHMERIRAELEEIIGDYTEARFNGQTLITWDWNDHRSIDFDKLSDILGPRIGEVTRVKRVRYFKMKKQYRAELTALMTKNHSGGTQ